MRRTNNRRVKPNLAWRNTAAAEPAPNAGAAAAADPSMAPLLGPFSSDVHGESRTSKSADSLDLLVFGAGKKSDFKCDFGFEFGKPKEAPFNNIFTPTQQLDFASTACTMATRNLNPEYGTTMLPACISAANNLRDAITKAKTLGTEKKNIEDAEAVLVEATGVIEKILTEGLNDAMEKRDFSRLKKYIQSAEKTELLKDLIDKAAARVQELTTLFAETPAVCFQGRVGKSWEFMGAYVKEGSSMVNGCPLFKKTGSTKQLFGNSQFLFKGPSGRWLMHEGQGSWFINSLKTSIGGMSEGYIRSTSTTAMLPTEEGLQFEYWDGSQYTLDELIIAASPAVSLQRAMETRDLAHLRCAVTVAEEGKLVEAEVSEKAKALLSVLVTEDATNKLQQVIKEQDFHALQSAITNAEEEKLVADALIEDAKVAVRTLASAAIEKALKESQWRCTKILETVSDLADAFTGLHVQDKEEVAADCAAHLVKERVELRGLTSKKHKKLKLNGCAGVVIAFDADSRRLSVKLDDGRGPFQIPVENCHPTTAIATTTTTTTTTSAAAEVIGPNESRRSSRQLEHTATVAAGSVSDKFPSSRDWIALNHLKMALASFSEAADEALVAEATSAELKQRAALVAASPAAVSIEGCAATMEKLMGTYIKAESSGIPRIVNGAPLYVKVQMPKSLLISNELPIGFLYKAKSGEWRFTSKEERIDTGKGMLRSTSKTAMLPTEEGLQFEYLNGQSYVFDPLITAALPVDRLRQAIELRDIKQLRSALAKAENEKLVDGAIINEAKALVSVLAVVEATEALRQAMEKREASELQAAISKALLTTPKLVTDEVIGEAKALMVVLATEKLQKVMENRDLPALRKQIEELANHEGLVEEAVIVKAKAVVVVLATKRLREAIEKRDQKHLQVVLNSEMKHSVLDKGTIDEASTALERLHIQRVMETRDMPSLQAAIATAVENGRVDSALLKEAHALVVVLASVALRRAMVKYKEDELKDAIKSAREISSSYQANKHGGVDDYAVLPLDEAESMVSEMARERLRNAMNICDATKLRAAIAAAEEEKVVEEVMIAQAKTALVLIPLKLSIGKFDLSELRKRIKVAQVELDAGPYVGTDTAILAEAKAQVAALATMRLRENIEKNDVNQLRFLVPLEEKEAVVESGLIEQAKALVEAESPIECCICYSQAVDCRLDPCGHVSICRTCSDDLASRAAKKGGALPKCPICRSEVKSTTTFGREVDSASDVKSATTFGGEVDPLFALGFALPFGSIHPHRF